MRNTATVPDDGILTSEASRILGVSAQSVRSWERRGLLHAIKTTGGVRVFSRRHIVEFAEARQREQARPTSTSAA